MRDPGQLLRFRSSLRPLPVLVLGFWFLHWRVGAPRVARVEEDPERAMVLALTPRGLEASASDVHFIPIEPSPLEAPVIRRRAILRAHRAGEPNDVFAVESRVAPSGTLLEVDSIYNLSATSAADEQNLAVSDSRAAWTTNAEERVATVQFADFRGERRPEGVGWNRPRRVQNALTNLQETGQLEGVGRRSFRLEPAAFKVVLSFSKNALLIDADSHKIRVADAGPVLEGAKYVKEVTADKARPGNVVTWAVDRFRTMPWFGDDRMQWLKAVAFDGVDQFEQIVNTVTGDDGSDSVKEELGDLFKAGGAEMTNPETGWPPPPMVPMLNPPLAGEGKWGSLEKDPFVQKNPNAPCPFVFSFIRTDRKRMYSQVFVTLWDPRQVELHAMSGTVEPISATGETGPGQVPRKPEVMSRYVGAFNGGFQAIHGEFGMMSERTLYLPPKPYGATVAELDDGTTAFGTWPEDLTVPSNIVSFRQNMTPLVDNGLLNPWKRYWWGGLPPGWTEEARTVRSGLCMTKQGFVGYFYGGSVDPDVLGLAMQRANCTFGMHLDMNPGHTGLEFYRAAPQGKLPAIKRRLDDVWEERGHVPGMPGWDFMGRRMMRLMALMNFPRYIGVEARDFFYLTLRPVLPGAHLEARVKPPQAGEGVWRVDGLPQYGWPYAIATTSLRGDAARPEFRVGLVKIDPNLVRVGAAGDPDPKIVVELRETDEPTPGHLALYHGATSGFHIATAAPPQTQPISAGAAENGAGAADASAAMGIDADGMLLLARVTAGGDEHGDGARLSKLLLELGCTQRLFLPHPIIAVMGGKADVSAPSSSVQLVRAAGPGVARLFPDTPIVGPKVWAPLQQKRVRYR